jgi:hypothetical protein
MSDPPERKKLFKEPNAWGWIALLVAVIAIGVATILFGGASKPAKGHAAASQTSAPPK